MPKSRKRKIKRPSKRPSSDLRFSNGAPGPSHIYRFFREEEHADMFKQGKVWLSTLAECRNYENPARGDAGEGTLTYLHKALSPERFANVPGAYEYAMSQTDLWPLPPGITPRFEGEFAWRKELPDCWILCCTNSFDPDKLSEDFGPFCVQVTNPALLYRKLTRKLVDEHLVEPNIDGNSIFAAVTYANREYSDLELPSGQIGLVKPIRYSDQQEARMLWRPKNGIESPLKGRLITLQSAESLFKRVA